MAPPKRASIDSRSNCTITSRARDFTPRRENKRAWPGQTKVVNVPIDTFVKRHLAKGGVLKEQHIRALELRGHLAFSKCLQEEHLEPQMIEEPPSLKSVSQPTPLDKPTSWNATKALTPDELLATIDSALRLDPPRKGQEPRFPREITLPVPAGYAWPKASCVALMSHTCTMCHTWSRMGFITISVADRRCILEPAPGCIHVIGSAQEFVASYPKELANQVEVWDSHPSCAEMNLASKSSWSAKIRDGTLLESALEKAWLLSVRGRLGMEQPPTGLPQLIGPPSFKLNARDVGANRFKGVWYWCNHLPALVANKAPSDGESHAHSSKVRTNDKELTALRRSTTDPHLALTLCALWDPRKLPPIDAAEASAKPNLETLENTVRHNYSIFAATYAPLLHEPTARAIIVVPIAYCESIVAHVSLRGTFGVLAESGSKPLRDQAIEASAFLNGACRPYLAGYTKDANAHAIFLLPVTNTPAKAIATATELQRARSEDTPSAWCTLQAIRTEPSFIWIVQAVVRFKQLLEPSPDSGLRIGVYQSPIATVPHHTAERWRRSLPKSTANEEWQAFIIQERERAEHIAHVWRAADAGDGKMIQWAENVRSAADLVGELQPPPQGLPDFTSELLLLTEYPKPPPAIGTEWLHTVPSPVLPEGFPKELGWHEALKLWGREMVVDFLNGSAEYELKTYAMNEAEILASNFRLPSHVLLGPGAFCMRKHADGIGEYCMNIAILERQPNGKLRAFDWNKTEYPEHRNVKLIIETIKRFLPDFSDHQTLSFLAQGTRYKANMPNELRLLRNLTSLLGRGAKAASTTMELIEAGAIKMFKLRTATTTLSADGPCPLSFLPGIKPPIGAIDKKDDPTKGRMTLDMSSPSHSMHDEPFRARNHPHGQPDGAHILGLNSSVGEKVKGPKRPKRPGLLPAAPKEPANRSVSPSAVQLQNENTPVPSHITDVRRRGKDSDASNPFRSLLGTSFEQRMICLSAFEESYWNPSLPLETVAARHVCIYVDRDHRGYDGFVLVRAVQRFAKLSTIGTACVFGCTCHDSACCRFSLVKWVSELIAKGIHAHHAHPFPYAEIKMRPTDSYCALGVLNHLAWLDNSFVTSSTDDINWMFYQMWTHPCEYPITMFCQVLPFEDEAGTITLYYCSCFWLVTNMGGTPNSKIACSFGEPWLEVWRVQMDKAQTEWLPTRSLELRHALQVREDKLGPKDARAFWADQFTDDHQFHFVSAELSAMGARLWIKQNFDVNWRTCKATKKQLGTLIDAIGARLVSNGGFGTITEQKRLRAISECALALQNKQTREGYESNNGLLVHLSDILDMQAGQLDGIYRPLKMPGSKSDLVHLTADARERHAEIIDFLKSKASASFWSAIIELPETETSPAFEARPLKLHLASDACTDVPNPGIWGTGGGIYYDFKLDEIWLRKHINVLEATGRGLNYLLIAPSFPVIPLSNENDNTSALSSGIHRAHTKDLQAVQRALERCASYIEAAQRAEEDHVSTIANELADAGSREQKEIVAAIAAAAGIKLRKLKLRDSPEAMAFLHEVLANTTDYDCIHPNPPNFNCGRCKLALTAIQYNSEVCPNCGDMHARLRGSGSRGNLPTISSAPPSPTIEIVAVQQQPQESTSFQQSASASVSPQRVEEPRLQHLTMFRDATPSPSNTLPPPPTPASIPAGTIVQAQPDAPHPPQHGNTITIKPPLPASAEAARLIAFQELERALIEDDSPFALLPNDPDKLRLMLSDSRAIILAGIPDGTLKADTSAVRWVARFCLEFDTPFMRPLSLSGTEKARESIMFARLVCKCAREMRPRANGRIGSNGVEITRAKPPSALAPLYGWRRILKSAGVEMVPLSSISHHIKGLNAQHKKDFGSDSMIRSRNWPLSQPQLFAIELVLREERVHSGQRQWTYVECKSMNVTFKFGLSAGERAEALSQSTIRDTDYYKRSHFILTFEDQDFVVDAESLARACNGWFIKGFPAPSKCDRSLEEWGDKIMWFRVNRDDPLNFAAAWIEWELLFPCPPDQRGQWAAFSPTGDAQPYKTSTLQSSFKTTLICSIGDLEAMLRAFHALRVTACTSLVTRKRPDGLVQAIIRWKTLEAMRLYGKMNRHEYANAVDEITTTKIDVSKATVAKLPVIDEETVTGELDDCMEWLKKPEEDAAKASLDVDSSSDEASSSSSSRPTNKPAPKGKQTVATVHAPSTTTVMLGEETVEVLKADKHDLTGKQVSIDNTLWPPPEDQSWDPNGSTQCTVVGLCAKPYAFTQRKKVAAYIIAEGDHNYPIKQETLLEQWSKQQRRAGKAPATKSRRQP